MGLSGPLIVQIGVCSWWVVIGCWLTVSENVVALFGCSRDSRVCFGVRRRYVGVGGWGLGLVGRYWRSDICYRV